MRALCIILSSLLLASCAVTSNDDDDTDDPSVSSFAQQRYKSRMFEVAVTPDLEYTPGEALDLYEPAGDRLAARPAIVWIHGGAFAKNSKSDPNLVRIARYFAQLGYVTVSIDYRLLNPNGDAGFPYPMSAVNAARDDAHAAIAYLRVNAQRYHVDPQRIAIGGASAGAITALEAAYAQNNNVKAVVDLWGSLEANLDQLRAGDAPLVIFHGTADNFWMPYAQALALRDRAHAVGVPVDFHPIDGAGHAPWDGLDRYLPIIATFLIQNLVD